MMVGFVYNLRLRGVVQVVRGFLVMLCLTVFGNFLLLRVVLCLPAFGNFLLLLILVVCDLLLVLLLVLALRGVLVVLCLAVLGDLRLVLVLVFCVFLLVLVLALVFCVFLLVLLLVLCPISPCAPGDGRSRGGTRMSPSPYTGTSHSGRIITDI